MRTVMKGLLFALAAAILLLSNGSIAGSSANGLYLYRGDPEASPIVEYTGRGGQDFWMPSEHARVVEFYSPYCPACRYYKPKYISLARETKVKHTQVDFYAVSCVAQKNMCKKFGVGSYPSILTFARGQKNPRKLIRGKGGYSVADLEKAFDLNGMTSSGTPEARSSLSSLSRKLENDTGHVDRDEKEVENWGDEEEKEHIRDSDGDEGEKNQVTNTEEDGDGSAADTDGDGDADENPAKIGEEDPSKESEGDDEEEEERGAPMEDAESGEDAHEEDEAEEDQSQEEEEEDSEDEDEPEWKARRARPGAETAKARPREMDKYKGVLARRYAERQRRYFERLRRNRLGGSASKPSEGSTELMKAHTPGTDEYEARRKDILKKLSKMKRGGEKALSVPGKIGKLPFKKIISKPRAVEKVPVVKRMVRMSNEEELILDASLSFLNTLKFGVFTEDRPLSLTQKRALASWLDLMSISLPQEWGLHELVDDLSNNIDFIAQDEKNLESIVSKHPLQRVTWSKSCVQGEIGGGYSCGLWKLFHTMTVGVAEHRGGLNLISSGLVREGMNLFSPMKAADTLREVIAHFFTCSECRTHFVGQYDQCDVNRRCDRLAEDEESATEADWKELAKWLWEVHNDVNVRLMNERADRKRKQMQRSFYSTVGAGPGAASIEDEVSVLWPTLHDCVTCFHEDGRWNEDAVFLYLEKSYWPGSDLDPKTKRLLRFEQDARSESGFTILLVCGCLVLLYMMRQSLSKTSIQRTILMARTMGRKGGVEKRRV